MTTITEKLTYISNQIKDIKGELSSYGVVGPAAVLSSLKAGIQALKTDLDDKAAEAAAVSAALDTLYGQYVSVSGDYQELSGKYDEISANYSTMSADYAAMSADYASVEEIIDSILSD